jgi:predicted DNA-binding transcriptional regulator YafY
MSDSAGRLLSVLSALQSRPGWTGPELAERVGVTVRTVRRDVERLRGLGYAIESTVGVSGGYGLAAGGTALPPLMLDEDEAVALAVCLRVAAGDTVAGVAEAAGRALAKVERTLPARLRPQLAAIAASTERLPGHGEPVDGRLLVSVSRACRERDVLRIRYADARGRATERSVEPYRVVHTGRRWYLVARDPQAGEWRTFRLDRVRDGATTGQRFNRHDPPDATAFVREAITTAPYRYRARVSLFAPVSRVAERVPATVGVLEAVDEGTTLLTTGANDLDLLALHIGLLGVGFRVHEPDALRERVAELAHRLAAGAAAGEAVGGPGGATRDKLT